MNIGQIHTGLLPIPPNGWGAVEKVIYAYYMKSSHALDIISIDDVGKLRQMDFVHVHFANQAKILQDLKIPYVFSLHDHHVVIAGKDSVVYRDNLLAMQGALLSFVHNPDLVDYFDGIPLFLPHGTHQMPLFSLPKLDYAVIVGSNGIQGDPLVDRKGWIPAIKAAVMAGMNVKLVCPKSNHGFISHHNLDHYVNEGYLSIHYDLSDSEMVSVVAQAKVMIHAVNEKWEAGAPPLTPLEAMELGTPVIGTKLCRGYNLVQYECTQDVYSILDALKSVQALNELEYSDLSERCRQKMQQGYHWEQVVSILDTMYDLAGSPTVRSGDSIGMPLSLHKAVNETANVLKKANYAAIEWRDGIRVVFRGTNREIAYNVSFYDHKANKLVYRSDNLVVQKDAIFAAPNRLWATDWRIEIEGNDGSGKSVIELDHSGRKVYVSIESSALGDSLAWLPVVEEFRKQTDAIVYVSTFRNELFILDYPILKFVDVGFDYIAEGCIHYRVGWYYDADGNFDKNIHRRDMRSLPLQKTASDILGIELSGDIRPSMQKLIDKIKRSRNVKDRKAGRKVALIAPHASASAKYWHNETGWNQLVDYLIEELGFEVQMITSENLDDSFHNNKLACTDFLKRVTDLTGSNYFIEDRIEQMLNADIFIGLGSGLSWLAWAVGLPVVLISGFSEPYTEMNDCYRVFNPDVCNGCFNRFKLDQGDWNWCPEQKDTEQMFVCTKAISAKSVIKAVELACFEKHIL